MDKILVPIDFSSGSINALEHAIKITNLSGAELYLIHVQKSKEFRVPDYFRDINRYYGSNVLDYFKILEDKYAKSIKPKYHIINKQGKVYREVCNYAEVINADIIILGTHGISGFEEFWMGSNAFKVVSNAPCPCITIRNGFLRKKIKRIVLPIDISLESRQKVPITGEIARLFNAEVHVVSVSESSSQDTIAKIEEYVNQVEDYLTKRNVKCVRDALLGSNITEITIEYAISVDAELISIMTEQAESTKNFLLGKYAQQMVNHSPIPVLSLNPKKNRL